ncbi:DER1-like protein [Plasmodium brasilianum]|uniref:Derlin n=2 Tax=Plasmodium (Plasmodium) TaxID=418103 RepID=A0A1A8VZF0_PLAMA|nr:DER1-like protein, putative [Plasmodium malariae]KAI4838947.1 DER1-like protein [Plasmodium brasilianum]SBS84761.1 DER1-like protein, putative [Plasmodium malariae]SCN12293.1 DER1-like protein, putative [Plasmodium malariae]
MFLGRIFIFLSITVNARYYAKVCIKNNFAWKLLNYNNTPLEGINNGNNSAVCNNDNAVLNNSNTPPSNSNITHSYNKLKRYYYYSKERNKIVKKKKKRFSLNYPKGIVRKNKQGFFFLNSTKLSEIKESIKALYNVDYIENNYLYTYIKSFKRTPPITKLYLISTFLLSVFIHINKNVYKLILFDFQKIFKKWEIWRLITPYLYIGNLYLQYILMFNYLNIYMSSVEIAHYRKPEDFLIFLSFGYISNLLFTIIGSMYNENIMNMKKHVYSVRNLIIPMNKKDEKIDVKKEHYNHLGYVFSTYILYYWSRINEGTLINCFELFLIKAEYVPFFFIIQNILLYNEFSLYEVASILSSYVFFTYEKYWKWTFLRRFFLLLLKFTRVYQQYNKYREEYE